MSQLKDEPPWGGHLIAALEQAGIIPQHTQKVIIEADIDHFVHIHTFGIPADGKKLFQVLASEVQGAHVNYTKGEENAEAHDR